MTKSGFVTDNYAVFGHPIQHSLSPKIHQLFALQCNETITYQAIEAPLDGFKKCLFEFHAKGGKGANITLPFKEQAFILSNELSQAAQIAGAVNTVFWRDNTLLGDNTDGMGLLRDLTIHHQLTLTAKRILILGAGGAARGVLAPLLKAQPALVAIANRTPEKAQDLVTRFSDLGLLRYQPPEATAEPFDLIINATASGINNARPFCHPSWISSSSFGYDMLYGSKPTPFLLWLNQIGTKRWANGLGMLIEQAACAYEVWRHKAPNTQAVRKALICYGLESS